MSRRNNLFISSFKQVVKSSKPTNDTLKLLLQKCGVPLPSAPNKTTLIQLLSNSLTSSSPLFDFQYQNGPLQLMSIDMGLQNFSFCKLELSEPLSKPVIRQWYKMNLNEYTRIQNTDFVPINFSNIINKVIFDLIYPSYKPDIFPDIVLVERQRFRTMGQKNVLESILKSNVLENMLISSLHTAYALEPSKYKATVLSTSPLTMANFWLSHYSELVGKNRSDLDSKLIRMELVQDWLNYFFFGELKLSPNNMPGFLLNENVLKQLRKSKKANKDFLKKYRATSRTVYEMVSLLNSMNEKSLQIAIANSESVRKGDDVSDSLLHGVAYIEFERFKHHIKNLITDNESLDLKDLVD